MLRKLLLNNPLRLFKNSQLRQFSSSPLNLDQIQPTPPPFLTSATKPIAYHKHTSKSPCVIYVPGFLSGKDGDKASFLKQHCLEKKYTYVCYDPRGIGDSPCNLGEVKFSDWVENAGSVLEHLGEEENVLVGSSLGAWISILQALKDGGRRIKGLVLIAPALNVFRPYYDIVMPKLDTEAMHVLNKGEVYTLNDEEHGEFKMWKALIEKIEECEIDVEGEVGVKCPVRILHGCQDKTIPFSAAIDVMNCLESEDVELVLRKSADHEFKDEGSLRILAETLDKLIEQTRN